MIEQLRWTFVDVLRSGTGLVHPGLLYVVVTLVIVVGTTFETINYYYYYYRITKQCSLCPASF